MAWRIVKQPNGKLARFSTVVDDFTDMDMTESETFELCREQVGVDGAKRKVQAGLEDWKPWTVGAKGNGSERWKDSLKTITNVHGNAVAKECMAIGVHDSIKLRRRKR